MTNNPDHTHRSGVWRTLRPLVYVTRVTATRSPRARAGIAVLVALVTALSIGGLAGATRTATVIPRMAAATSAADLMVNPDRGDQSRLDMARVAALPMVAKVSKVHPLMLIPPGPIRSLNELELLPLTATTDGHMLWDWARPVINAGRMPDPGSDHEVLVQKFYADAHGIGVGDVISVRALARTEMARMFSVRNENELAAVTSAPGFGRAVDLQVTGIGVTFDGVVVDQGFEPVSMMMGPALFDEMGRPKAGFWGAMVQLTDPEQLPALEAAVDAMVPDERIVYQTRAHSDVQAQRATMGGAVALRIFSAVAIVLGLILIAQAISRWLQSDRDQQRLLASLGTTRRQRWLLSLLQLAPVVAVGAGVGGLLAYLLSGLSPVGLGRVAEVNPGLAFDPIMVVGPLVGFAIVMTLAAAPAWRAAASRQPVSPARPSAVAAWLSTRGAPFPVTTGVRFGLERGRGQVPARATVVGAATGVSLAVATLTFAASLTGIVSQPRFYGNTWDGIVSYHSFDDSPVSIPDSFHAVADRPEVATASVVGVDEVLINGEKQTGIAFSQAGEITASIAEGQAPGAPDEVALGKLTMDHFGVGIGDHVDLSVTGYQGPATVVGRAVLPGVGLYPGSDRMAMGVGTVVSPDAMGKFFDSGPAPEASGTWVVAFTLAPGVEPQSFYAELSKNPPPGLGVSVEPVGRSGDVASLERLQALPLILAAVLVALIAATVGHALVIAARGRRRDLAVLRAMGARNRSLRMVGVVQGGAIAVVALVIGIPVGVVLGRLAWTWLATEFGAIATPAVPVVAIGAFSLLVVAMSAAAGLVPVQFGMRGTTAEVLSGE